MTHPERLAAGLSMVNSDFDWYVAALIDMAHASGLKEGYNLGVFEQRAELSARVGCLQREYLPILKAYRGPRVRL